MKASFDAIAAAKTHTVVLDFVPNKKTTGKAGATTKTVTTKVVKPAAKPVEKPAEVYVEYTKKPEGIQDVFGVGCISMSLIHGDACPTCRTEQPTVTVLYI